MTPSAISSAWISLLHARTMHKFYHYWLKITNFSHKNPYFNAQGHPRSLNSMTIKSQCTKSSYYWLIVSHTVIEIQWLIGQNRKFFPPLNLGFWVGRSNNINSFVLYMLLIQYLQFIVFSQGGGSLILVFFLRFFYSLMNYVAAYSGYLFFLHFFGIIFIR